jgi:Fe2+ transport system protein FeoA
MWPSVGAIGPFRGSGPIGLNRPVSNPESATRISSGGTTARPFDRLVDAAPGRRLLVVAVGPDHESALAQEGLGVGAEISVERRVALGGPLIVRLGPARLALARGVAGAILVAPADGSVEPGTAT